MPKLVAHIFALFLGTVGLLNCSQAAGDDASKNFSISGFGTLGSLYNSTGKADFARDLAQSSGAGYTRRLDFGVDSRLGVQLNARAGDTISGAVQVVSHHRYDDTFRPELTWAFAKYAPNESVQLRVGRLGLDVYMLADSRHIGYSYFLVRPPVDYFGTVPLSYFDGADLVLKLPIGEGIARAKFFAGNAREKIRSDGEAEFDMTGSQVKGVYGEYQLQKWQYRLGYGQIRLHDELPGVQPLLDELRSPFLSAAFGPAPAKFANDAMAAGKAFGFYSAGVVYDSGPLQAQLVLSHISSDSLAYQSNNAGYFTLAYRNKQWMPYFAYAAVKSEDKRRETGLPSGIDPGIDALIGGAQQMQIGNANKQNTVSIGVRYDFMRNADIKFQLDRVHASKPFFWRNVQPGWDGRATLLSVTLDFVF